MLKRAISLNSDIKYSVFFFGPRKTGKSTYLKKKFPKSKYFDLLEKDVFNKLIVSPHLLREEILAAKENSDFSQPVIIDEIQKLPLLLDEVHWLIENANIIFILCGSSARKLYKAGVNLLGGRAISKKCFPLSFFEFFASKVNFDLLRAMQQGLIPSNYLEDDYQPLLDAYVHDYLALEIKNEGLVRSLPSFYKFLESVSFTNGELVNYSKVATDCAVSANTIKEYYQILCDTLVGNFIYPYKSSHKRQIISSTPKFYLFDIGIANWLSKTNITHLQGELAGKSFEHFIYLELLSYTKYNSKFVDIYFWRTKSGLEVDFIISEKREVKIAIECKISSCVKKSDLKGILAFSAENENTKMIVVSQDKSARLLDTPNGNKITIMPWQDFLKNLWEKEYF